MGSEVAAVAPPMAEVPMVEAEAVREMRELAGRGWGAKRIARELGLARNTVSLTLRRVEARRAGDGSGPERRPCLLDPYDAHVRDLLARYPDLNATRLLEELRQRGFTGGYTVVRLRLRELRPRPTPLPVIRFETAPGAHYGKSRVMCDSLRSRGCLT